MKKIVFFVSSMQGGGAERVAALLCNRWAKQGCDVLLVPTYSDRGSCEYSLDARVRLVYLADLVRTRRKTVWSLLRRLMTMRSLVREFRAEVVVSFLSHVNIAALFATQGLGVSVVVAERTYPPAMNIGPIWSNLRRLVYPWASYVVMQTQLGLAWLADASPRSRGAVIPNPCIYPLPVSDPLIDPGIVDTGGRRLLIAAGRFGKEKGFDLLIRAFAMLASRFDDWDLVILGDGIERQSLERQIAILQLNKRIFLPGRVGNIGDWYACADLYVLSSRFEGFPNSLMEAMAYGVPVISFDCATGPADLVDDGINGYLIPPDEGIVGLAERLEVLMADCKLRSSMGERASEVRSRYALDRVGAEWDMLLGLKS